MSRTRSFSDVSHNIIAWGCLVWWHVFVLGQVGPLGFQCSVNILSHFRVWSVWKINPVSFIMFSNIPVSVFTVNILPQKQALWFKDQVNVRDWFAVQLLVIKSQWWGTSLVVQWLRNRLPMQGTQVRALVLEDPTCRGATKPVHRNYWASTLESSCHNYWPCMPQLLSPRV